MYKVLNYTVICLGTKTYFEEEPSSIPAGVYITELTKVCLFPISFIDFAIRFKYNFRRISCDQSLHLIRA